MNQTPAHQQVDFAWGTLVVFLVVLATAILVGVTIYVNNAPEHFVRSQDTAVNR
ncbi:MAG: hypothetical protein P4L33_10720 [Capsulimonadaceae bacterium]|nr:hypothetical protein [Capsulimonadaceae bacterium]